MVVPVIEGQPVGQYLLREQTGRGVSRGRLDAARADGQVTEAKLIFRIDALRASVIKDPGHGSDVLGEQLAQPVFFDCSRQAQQGLDALVLAFHFADFSGDQERAVLDDAFPGQCAAPAMHQLATGRAGVQPPGYAVAEAKENALLQSLVGDFAAGGIEAFAPGEFQELLEQRTDLAGGDGVHARPAAGLGPEVAGGGVVPGAHQQPEVATGLFAEEFLAVAGGVDIYVA